MGSPLREQRLQALRDTIAEIERKPALRETRENLSLESDAFPVFPGGLLQEVFTDQPRNSGAVLGFALAQARRMLSARRVGIVYLQLIQEAQELGLPYGPALGSFGLAPHAVTLVRVENMVELLWAAEQALACGAVAAVVADVVKPTKLLDFTASRRLSLRAAAAGASIFLLRYGTGREASAAHLRWRLMPARSGRKPFDDRAPGSPRWQAELERGALVKQQASWLLEWSRNGFATVSSVNRSDDRSVSGAAVSRP